MKKRLASILLALVMLLSLLPAAALAGEPPAGAVAYVTDATDTPVDAEGEEEGDLGGGYYKTLQAAINAAQSGDTIKLLTNVALTAAITLNKNLTIDLNGLNLNCDAVAYPITVSVSVTVTFKDSIVTGSVTQNTSVSGLKANLFDVKGTLNIESGTYSTNGVYGVYYMYDTGTLNISGGTSRQNTDGKNIVGGSGAVNITGGYFNKNAVYGAGYKLMSETVVSETLYHAVPLTENEAVASITRNGTTVLCGSLSSAISNAKSGETVKLLKDETVTGNSGSSIGSGAMITFLLQKSITLDLAGHAVTMPNNAVDLYLNGSNKLTITDSSEEGNGKFLFNGTNFKVISGSSVSTSNLIVSGGYYNIDVSGSCAPGYKMVDGTGDYATFKHVVPLTEEEAFAKIVRGGNPLYFATLQTAMSAADNGETVILLKNAEDVPDIFLYNGNAITLDMNNCFIRFGEDNSFALYSYGNSFSGGKLNITGTGTIYGSNKGVFYLCGNQTASETDVCEVTLGKNVTVDGGGYAVWFAGSDSEHDCYNAKADIYGKIIGHEPVYVSGNVHGRDGNGGKTDNVPIVNIHDGAVIECTGGDGLYLAGYAKTTIGKAKLTSEKNVISIAAGELTIDGANIVGGDQILHEDGSGGSIDFDHSSAIFVKQHGTNLPLEVIINSGEFKGAIPFNQATGEKGEAALPNLVTLEISGGRFDCTYTGTETTKATIKSDDKTGFITGGFFTHAPNASYIAPDEVVRDTTVEEKTEQGEQYLYTLGRVAKIVGSGETSGKVYDTLQAALDAAEDGDTVVLLADIELSAPARLDKVGTFTIDGNGKTISAAEGASFGADGCLCFGPGGEWTADQVSTKTFTIKNTTFSGFTTDINDVIRAEGCTLTIDKCTFDQNTVNATARSKAVVLLTGVDAKIINSTFSGNTAGLCIDFNTQGGSANSQTKSNVKVDNCYFHNNTLSGNGVMYLYGPGGSVTNNTFEGNSITADGAAVIYLSGKADRIANNLFKSNTVTAGGTGKLGVIAFGSSTAKTAAEENAFVGNTLNKNGKASTSGTAYVGAENISLERNYWGDGAEPETGDEKDIYANKSVAVKEFATAYTLKSNSYGVNVYVYAPEEVPENIAKNGETTYTSYANAKTAAAENKFGAGWYFNVDPSADLADNCIVVASDDADWLYMVQEKAEGTANVKTDIEPGKEEAEVTNNSNTAAVAAAAAVNDVDKTLGGVKDLQPDAASKLNDAEVINNTLKSKAEQELAEDTSVNYNSETDTLMLVIEPYFDVEVTGGETDDTGTATITSITYQIDAKYNILATTAATTEQIVKNGVGQNTVTVEEGIPLEVTKAVTLSIPLPDEFYADDGEKVIVKHTHDDKTYLYDGTIVVKDGKKFVTFTNPDGFSEFEIMKATLLTGAKIERTAGTTQFYATLEEAVADVQDGETIVLLSDAAAETITVGKVVTFTVKNDGHSNAASIVAGSGYTVSKNGNIYTVTEYVAPHHHGGGSKPVTPPVVEPETNEFVDVPAEAYYAEAVAWAADKGITQGTDATHFSPNKSVTRAQAVTFLWRAAGCPKAASALNPFTDVAADAYYYEAVLWAVENGITNGTTDTTFSPNVTCSRAHIVSFLYRYAKAAASETTNPFTDVAADAYYYEPVLWAVANGVTGGKTDTLFAPTDTCTRAQVVTFLYRWMVK